jgi:hypothetical protein
MSPRIVITVVPDTPQDEKFVRDVEALCLEHMPAWTRLFDKAGTLTITWDPDTVPGNVPPLQRNDK